MHRYPSSVSSPRAALREPARHRWGAHVMGSAFWRPNPRAQSPGLSNELALGNGSQMLGGHGLTIAITPARRGLFQTTGYTSHSNHHIFLRLWYHPAGKSRNHISREDSTLRKSQLWVILLVSN